MPCVFLSAAARGARAARSRPHREGGLRMPLTALARADVQAAIYRNAAVVPPSSASMLTFARDGARSDARLDNAGGCRNAHRFNWIHALLASSTSSTRLGAEAATATAVAAPARVKRAISLRGWWGVGRS